jgi:hypothetical protein
MPFDEADRLEAQRRVETTIARASACHMSDIKWRKLLCALRQLDVGPLRWKFVRDERVFVARVPPASAVLESGLGDVPPYQFGPYREIEWVEIPVNQATRVVEALAEFGRFPLQKREDGLRVSGYSW